MVVMYMLQLKQPEVMMGDNQEEVSLFLNGLWLVAGGTSVKTV